MARLTYSRFLSVLLRRPSGNGSDELLFASFSHLLPCRHLLLSSWLNRSHTAGVLEHCSGLGHEVLYICQGWPSDAVTVYVFHAHAVHRPTSSELGASKDRAFAVRQLSTWAGGNNEELVTNQEPKRNPNINFRVEYPNILGLLKGCIMRGPNLVGCC